MATYHIQDQGHEGTCYAHASTRAMLHAWRRVEGAMTPSYQVLVAAIIHKYGTHGAHTENVVKFFGDPQARQGDASFDQILTDLNQTLGDWNDYFELPVLRLEALTSAQLTLEKLNELHLGNQQLLLSFWLTDTRWAKFRSFYAQHKHGVLEACDLSLKPNETEITDNVKGHAVVVDPVQSTPAYLAMKNSWGQGFAAHGSFFVNNIEVLSPHPLHPARLFMIGWNVCDIGQTLQQRFNALETTPIPRIERRNLFVDHSVDLAEGSHATRSVYPGRYEGEDVAVKTVRVENRDMKFCINHPHIIRTIGWCPLDDTAGNTPMQATAVPRRGEVQLVMEKGEGSLEQLFEQLSAHEIRRAVCHVVKALEYFHERHIIHLDVKPSNVLKVGNMWKLCDFDTLHHETTFHGTSMGTDGWTDPKVLAGTARDLSPKEKPYLAMYSVGQLLKKCEVSLGELGETCLSYPLASRPTPTNVFDAMQRQQADEIREAYRITTEGLIERIDKISSKAKIAVLKRMETEFRETAQRSPSWSIPQSAIEQANASKKEMTDKIDALEHAAGKIDLDCRQVSTTNVSNWLDLYAPHIPDIQHLELGPSDEGIPENFDRLQHFTSLRTLVLRSCSFLTDTLKHLGELASLHTIALVSSRITDEDLMHIGKLKSLQRLNLSGCKNITDGGLAHLKSLTFLTDLDLTDCYNITDGGLAHLKSLKFLTNLDLSGCKNITDGGLAHLKSLTSLTDLDLTDCYNITDGGLAHLKSLTSLTNLDLSGCKNITDGGLAHLKSLTSLTNLYLISCDKITDGGLAHLKSLTSLTKLNLWGCYKITDGGLAHLKSLTSLTNLNLCGCDKITDAGLGHLKSLTSLTNLNLCGCDKITDGGLAHLKSLTSLTNLDLSGCDNITDGGLAHLKSLTSLTHLNLRACHRITDGGLAHLKSLTSLTDLDLCGCDKITDGGLAHLKSLTSLTNLDLTDCDKITDGGLAHLKALTSLTNLNLCGCDKITDGGLAHLKSLTSLTNLNLWGCDKITDGGLAHLKSLTSLTDLDLRGCDKITDGGLAHLKSLTSLVIAK